jgi:hypothetical protein
MPLIAPIFCASKILIPAFEEVTNRWASYPQLTGSADEALSFYECTFSLECFIYLLKPHTTLFAFATYSCAIFVIPSLAGPAQIVHVLRSCRIRSSHT